MAASAQSLHAAPAGALRRLWRSPLGKKYVMAITGLGLWVFVIVHLLGNLQIFLGPERLNAYGRALKEVPALLWGARIGLLTIAVSHITAAAQLSRANRRARRVSYAHKKPVASTLAQRTVLASGLILLVFIIFHLAHFTLGWIDPRYLELKDPLDMSRHDVYHMMIMGFSNPLVSVFYIFAMGFLLLHLTHGVSSAFQSLGLRSKKTFGFFDKLARISALLIFLGNCAIPLAILFGFVR